MCAARIFVYQNSKVLCVCGRGGETLPPLLPAENDNDDNSEEDDNDDEEDDDNGHLSALMYWSFCPRACHVSLPLCATEHVPYTQTYTWYNMHIL